MAYPVGGNELAARTVKVNIPLFLVSIVIGVSVASYFLALPEGHPLIALREKIETSATLICTWILLYSLVTLALWHTRRMVTLKYTRDFYVSGVTLTLLIILILIYLAAGRSTFDMIYSYTAAYISAGAIFSWIYFTWGTFQRVKIFNIETTALFITWLFTVMRQQTSLITYIPVLDDIGYWVETALAQGAIWALYISAGVSIVILAIRAFLGRERAPFELGV